MKAPSLLNELLAEQQQLTAVERFAQRHEQNPERKSKYYEDLIPLERPLAGQQYGFRVDLDSCTGCKACVSACHSLNGLDENETWRTVGLLHGGSPTEPYQQTITSACHHCLEPGCLEGCPVLAYEKDPATGIVRHLDDQCIGCQYCLLKCPYDVPKYSSSRGIVRKCDMCHGRLAQGEPPACVQACPSGAITIQIVSRRELASGWAGSEGLVPGAFPSDYTKPATSYVSSNPFPRNCAPADATTLRLEPAHWPLVWMLVLTQAAAGLFGAAWLAAIFAATLGPAIRVLYVAGCLLLYVGLGASVFHLGRPLGAWRAFLGWRKSWMSREIMAFVVFAALALGLAIGAYTHPGSSALSTLSAVTAGSGFLAVFCSAMIYVDTRRACWNAAAVFGRFLGTAVLLGASSSACCLAWTALPGRAPIEDARRFAAGMAIAAGVFLFAWETVGRKRALRKPTAQGHRFAQITSTRLAGIVRARAALFVVATVSGLAATLFSGPVGAGCATILLACTTAAQIAERYSFFVASAGPGMPGGVAS